MVEVGRLRATTTRPWAVQNDPDASRPRGPSRGLTARGLQRRGGPGTRRENTPILPSCAPRAQPSVPSSPQNHGGLSARRAASQEAGGLHPRETRPVRSQTGDVGEAGALRGRAVRATGCSGGAQPTHLARPSAAEPSSSPTPRFSSWGHSLERGDSAESAHRLRLEAPQGCGTAEPDLASPPWAHRRACRAQGKRVAPRARCLAGPAGPSPE